RMLIATTRGSSRPASDLPTNYRLAWLSSMAVRPIPLPGDADGVVDAAVEPSSNSIAAITGGGRLLRAHADGAEAAGVLPPLGAVSPVSTDTFLSVAWVGSGRLLVRETAPHGLYEVESDGRNRTGLPWKALDPRPSPDGSRLAFTQAVDGAEHFSAYVTED